MAKKVGAMGADENMSHHNMDHENDSFPGHNYVPWNMNMVLFCFAVVMLTVPIGIMWSIYPYSSGLFTELRTVGWLLQCRGTVKWPWSIWIKSSGTQPQDNLQKGNCIYFGNENVYIDTVMLYNMDFINCRKTYGLPSMLLAVMSPTVAFPQWWKGFLCESSYGVYHYDW